MNEAGTKGSGCQGPLDGVRVVDLTVVWSGPGATMILGDLGAEVIRVEDVGRTSRGIPTRFDRKQMSDYHAHTFVDSDPGDRPYERSSTFNWHARNKLSVTMSLTEPEGMEAFLALVEQSDVLVENNSPGVLEKLGLGYDVLSARNPRLIVARMPPLGLSGPMSQYLGYGPNFNSLVGIAAMDGYEGEDPTTAGENYHMDESSPAGMAFAIMTALWDRDTAGLGQLIEFSQADNLMQEVGECVLDYQMNGRNPPIRGNADPHMLQGVVRTGEEDRWIALSIRGDDDWRTLCRVIGSVAALDPDHDGPSRLRHATDILKAIEAWTTGLTPAQIVERLQSERVPAGEVMSELRLLNSDAQLESREWFQTREVPGVGTHRYPGHPWKVDGFPLAWGRPLPGLGQDNEYVYKELLGYTDERYQDLVERGSIGSTQL